MMQMLNTAGPAVLGEGGFKDMFLKWNFRAPAASPMGASSDWLFYWIFIISAIFFVILMVMMVVFAIRYRKVPGRVPQRSASHNTLLELSWSVIPTILLVWMFFEGFYGYADKVVSPTNAREVIVSAQKWNWSFQYPNGSSSSEVLRTRSMTTPGEKAAGSEKAIGTQEIPILYVPEKQPVRLKMSSTDVIHAFWIPDFRVKFDVMPNRFTSMWFNTNGIDSELAGKNDWKLFRTVFNEETKKNERVPFLDANGQQYVYNDHWVFCAEYCGSMHSEMLAVVRVVPEAAYEQLLKDFAEPTGTPDVVGAALYRIKGCNACHSVDGSKNVGPTWKDIYGEPVELADGTTLSAAQMSGVEFDNYIRKSVYEPAAQLVKGYPNQMQSYQGRINDKELNAIIAYMKSLSSKAPKDTGAPAGDAKPGEQSTTEQKPADQKADQKAGEPKAAEKK